MLESLLREAIDYLEPRPAGAGGTELASSRPGEPSRRMARRGVQALALALGAPLGWLALEAARGFPPERALRRDRQLYLYMWLGTGIVFGGFGLLLGRREAELLGANRTLERLATTDGLTGLRNSRYFHARLDEEHAEYRRGGRPLALVILDIDRFKRINDRYGHTGGDEVLVTTARAILAVSRQGETEARIGGEEFGLLLPDSTGDQAREVAERVRGAIGAAETFLSGPAEEAIRITASAGVASTAEFPQASTFELYQAADAALYRAKEQGRDRTVVAGLDVP